jgi:hypothetical protein
VLPVLAIPARKEPKPQRATAILRESRRRCIRLLPERSDIAEVSVHVIPALRLAAAKRFI